MKQKDRERTEQWRSGIYLKQAGRVLIRSWIASGVKLDVRMASIEQLVPSGKYLYPRPTSNKVAITINPISERLNIAFSCLTKKFTLGGEYVQAGVRVAFLCLLLS